MVPCFKITVLQENNLTYSLLQMIAPSQARQAWR